MDSYWEQKLAADADAERIIQELAASPNGFNVTEGGRAIGFLKRDSFFNDHALYSNYIKNGADLYDRALKDWGAMGSGGSLADVVRPSTLAVLYAASDRTGSFYYADPALSAADNARREQLVLSETITDITRAGMELDSARQRIQTALGDASLSPTQKMALVEQQIKLERQTIKVAEAQANFLQSVAPYRLGGAGQGRG